MMKEPCVASAIRMTNLRVLLQPAYVLHQRPYRDTSALLELFTPEHGRVGVIAKGVRGAKPRWRALLQPFQPLLVSWNLRGELGTLTEAEAQGVALNIPPQFIASGFYLNEILLRLLHRHEAQLELFGCYDAALRSMAELGLADSEPRFQLEILLRRFEVSLLHHLGYGLVLDRDVQSGLPIQPEQKYAYHLEHGPQLINAEANVEASDQNGLQISGSTLRALANNNLATDENLREAKRLLRTVLSHYLGPKPLQSRQLVQKVVS